MHHRGIHDADDVERRGFDFLEKFAGTARPDFARLRRMDEQINPVQFFPQFHRDLVAHHAGVFARGTDALDDGVGVLRLEHEKFRHGIAGRVRMQFEKTFFIAGRHHDGFPVFDELFLIKIPHVEQQLQIDVHNARDVFGPFGVAGHPVE